MDAAPHVRLQAKLAATEDAVQALLAECQQPDVRAALEVRARARWRCATRRDGPRRTPCTHTTHAARVLLTSSCAAAQARDLGYASATASAQLEATRLLARLDGVTRGVQGVSDSVACHVSAEGSVGARVTPFSALPHTVALKIFCLIPADQRARIALVCRAWRDAVADPDAWTRLCLYWGSGVSVAVTDATLRAAAARANGQLRVLDVDNCDALTPAAIMDVVTASKETLLSLSCLREDSTVFKSFDLVETLALAAPQLKCFYVDAAASTAETLRMLRRDFPFEALQLCKLKVDGTEEDLDERAVLELASALQEHEALTMLALTELPTTPAALDEVFTEALQLKFLKLKNCPLGPASIPGLAHLIRRGKLTTLNIRQHWAGMPLFDAAGAALLASAFMASKMCIVILDNVDFWNDEAAGVAVLNAFIGHPTLQWLDLGRNNAADGAAAGVALGALIAADSRTLTGLRVAYSLLGDVGLASIFDALPHNTHLRMLSCSDVGMSVDFARERFLPAVRANTSLRTLSAGLWWDNDEDGAPPPEVLEAEELVAARDAADDA